MPEPGRDTVALAVVESTQAGEARRLAAVLVKRIGFEAVGMGEVALIVTELANNLVRHATQGEMILQRIENSRQTGIEILAIDRGPGVTDFRRCLTDGYSTSGTPGTGLGAVARHADSFDVHSVAGRGTVIAARVWTNSLTRPDAPNPHPTLDLGAVCLPIAGEVECGDAWGFVEPTPGRSVLMVADGLGHGPKAAEASDRAVATFRRNSRFSPGEHLAAVHQALIGTRGAAVAVAAINHDRRELCFAGVGNIAGKIFETSGQSRGLVSHNGTVGGNMHKVQEFTLPWPTGALLVLNSDGLATQWRLDDQPVLRSKAVGLIAGSLYRDFSRGRDDVTVVVAREGSLAP